MTLYAQVGPCTLFLLRGSSIQRTVDLVCLTPTSAVYQTSHVLLPPSEPRKGQLLNVFQPTLASFPFHCDPSSDKDIHCHFDFRNQFPPLGSVWFYSNIECHFKNVYCINSLRIPCVHDVLIIFTHPTSLLNSPQTHLCYFPSLSLLQASFPLSLICAAHVLGCGTISSTVDLTGTMFLKKTSSLPVPRRH